MTRSLYEELNEVREYVQDYDDAIFAAQRHVGEGTPPFTPDTLRQATSQLVLQDQKHLPLYILVWFRDGAPDDVTTEAINRLIQVRDTLRSASANGLPPLNRSTPPLLAYVHARLQQAEAATENLIDSLRTMTSRLATPMGLRDVGQSVSSISAYPLLTGAAWGTNSGHSSGSTPSMQHLVDSSVRDVIGRLPRYTDARAFTAALAGSFAIDDHAGVRTVRWRPRTSVGSGDLGASVTGMQASVYARALSARDAVRPLLHGLRPLRADSDEQEMDAARNVVQAEVDALVEELGTEGGPRKARVEQLFDVLFNQSTSGPWGTVGGGMVGYLGYTFGLADDQGDYTNEQVNTVEEEQEFSNYLLLVDHLKTLRASWITFAGQSGSDLGTQLYQLSRTLQVVAESIDEIESALDSVFIGDAEQGVIRFDTVSSGEMLLAELFNWVRSFAATEAPALVTQGGRRGMGPIVDTANRLGALTDDLVQQIASDDDLPDGLRHPRVRYPLQELRGYLQQVATLAQRVI